MADLVLIYRARETSGPVKVFLDLAKKTLTHE